MLGFYPDTPDSTPRLGEVFIKIAKEGSTLSGMCDALATTISVALQHGVPWDVLRDKYMYARFEPSGDAPPNTIDREGKAIPTYHSLVHAIANTIDEAISYRINLWSK
jgi:hypothetical protein